jgi:hypothetical protein
MVTRLSLFVMASVCAGVSTLSAQEPLCVAMRLEIQDDNRNSQFREIRTPEGRATATVQIKQADSYPTFYLDVSVLDHDSGLIRVSIRTDRNSDAVVDEFDLQTEGGTRSTATSPSFGVGALQIFDRVGYSCSAG